MSRAAEFSIGTGQQSAQDPMDLLGELMNAGVLISNFDVLVHRLQVASDWHRQLELVATYGHAIRLSLAWRSAPAHEAACDILSRYGFHAETARRIVGSIKLERVGDLSYTSECA